MCNDALRVIGFHGPGDKISLFVHDWELARVALSCHVALELGLVVGAREASSHRGRAVVNRRDVGRKKKREEGTSRRALLS